MPALEERVEERVAGSTLRLFVGLGDRKLGGVLAVGGRERGGTPVLDVQSLVKRC